MFIRFLVTTVVMTFFTRINSLAPPSSKHGNSFEIFEETLALAREYKNSQLPNLARARGLYMNIVNQAPSNEKFLPNALFELSTILEEENSMTSRELGFEYLVRAAEMGLPAAQHRLAVAYMTGFYGGLIPIDPARALLLEYMAALAGDMEASLGMGYRYLKGVGVPEKCSTAVSFLEMAANTAASQIEARGVALFSDRSHIADRVDARFKRDVDEEVTDYYRHLAEEGDDSYAAMLGTLYLQGSRMVDQDLIRAEHFLRLAVKKAHVHSSAMLGLLIAQGIVRGDAQEAVKLLTYSEEYKNVQATLGRAYCLYKGFGMEKNESKAFEVFRSIADRVPDAAFYMGEILMGHATSPRKPSVATSSVQQGGSRKASLPRQPARMPRDEKRELSRRNRNPPPKRVREESQVPAQVKDDFEYYYAYGKHQPGRQMEGEKQDEVEEQRGDAVDEEKPPSETENSFKADPAKAVHAYAHASQRGHILSLHRTAHMSIRGLGTPHSCEVAAVGFKSVAERGDWAKAMSLGHRKYINGDHLGSLQQFTRMAAIGIEPAQANAAFILARVYCPDWLQLPTAIENSDLVEKSAWPAKKRPGQVPWDGDIQRSDKESNIYNNGSTFTNDRRNDCQKRSLAMYLQSASQGNGDALLKVGDFYYYGSAGLARDKSEAALYYQLAADLRNTHALFNLGLMHETGDGVEQDFHLAKRLFDQAAEFDEAARLPRAIALLLLQGHMTIQSLFGTDILSKYIFPIFISKPTSVDSGLPSAGFPMSLDFQIHHLPPWVRSALSYLQPIFDLLQSAGNEVFLVIEGAYRGLSDLLDKPIQPGENDSPMDLDIALLVILISTFIIVLRLRGYRRIRRILERMENRIENFGNAVQNFGDLRPR